jgi:hypothetical protein
MERKRQAAHPVDNTQFSLPPGNSSARCATASEGGPPLAKHSPPAQAADAAYKRKLPHEVGENGIALITWRCVCVASHCVVIRPQVCAALVSGQQASFARVCIVDCRFDYEFNGGHLKGAINVRTQEQLIDEFLKVRTTCNYS